MKRLSAVFLALLAACSSTAPDRSDFTAALAPYGGHSFPVTTSSPVAQRNFDIGLAWCYGFHHAEAMRYFRAALAADPECAMAYWGLAYAAGPHINNMEMSPESAETAHENAGRAQALAANATPLEQALIAAVVARYEWPAPEDRKSLDVAYAAAMRPAYERFPDHPDVAVLFAESLMNLRPWDLWGKDGSPRPETPEVIAVLERTMAAHPRHAQANHLYIHAVEASPEPGRAVAAGDRLRGIAPAIGHLEHMPSHAYILAGRYEDAAVANRLGIAADLAIVEKSGSGGFFEIYRAHNYHFLAYSAMFTGNEAEAIKAARELTSELPAEVVRAMPQFLEGFLAVPLHVLVRFGRWEQVLREPQPPEWQKGHRAVWHYARGVALAALRRSDEAMAEQAAFTAACAEVPEGWTMGNNPTRAVLEVGAAFLAGEVEFRRGNQDEAFAKLRRASELEHALQYDEPWGWMMPPAHALGALLLEANRVAEAQKVYEADLVRHPENGWALQGLAECLERSGDSVAAAAVTQRFKKSWRHATVAIKASCFCRQ